MIKTKLCDMTGIKYPIIQAGMGPYSTTKLAAAVANAGALGIISGIGMGAAALGVKGAYGFDTTKSPRKAMLDAIETVKNLTTESKGIFGINTPVAQEFFFVAKELIEAAVDARKEDPEVEERLRVFITSAGNPAPVVEEIKKSGALHFHVVPSAYHAKKVESMAVDAIIASGHEAGGHVAFEPVHTMIVVPAVVNAVKTPVIAAGGFCDGATFVSALALGAIGVQMGTRFIATQESDFLQAYKEYVVQLAERDTLVARGLFGNLRYLKNNAAQQLAKMAEEGISEDKLFKFELKSLAAIEKGDIVNAAMPGGEVTGRINEIPTVKQLVERIMRESEEIIRKMPKEFLV